VPHEALGAELSTDHHDRTRIFGWKAMIGSAGSFLAVGGIALLDRADDPREVGAQLAWAMWVALPLCVHLIGPARAKEMVILAKRFKADTLLDWGFLDRVVPQEQLLEKSLELAEEYAAMPPMGAQMVKRSVNMITSALDQPIMHMDSDQYLYATSGEDSKEAMSAFFEKRTGVFKGN
jgi:enoyl-CoA hydratase/carnithine racemase